MIGSDLAHSRMVEFPADTGLYLDARTRQPLVPDDFSVARAVGRVALSVGKKERVRYAKEVRTAALECLRLDSLHAGA